jgi:hypothetical protein
VTPSDKTLTLENAGAKFVLKRTPVPVDVSNVPLVPIAGKETVPTITSGVRGTLIGASATSLATSRKAVADA